MKLKKPTISNYENDRIDIKSSVIAELAKAFETDPYQKVLKQFRKILPGAGIDEIERVLR